MTAGSPPRDEGSKRCNACHLNKPRDQFYVRRGSADGLGYTCKDCTKTRAGAWYENNRDRAAEYKRRAEVKRRKAVQDKRYQQANRERIAAHHAAYYQANRERIRGQQARRYAEVKAEVLAHYGTVCACCGTTRRLSIDHTDGGGAQHRTELYGDPRKAGERFYYWLIRQGFPPGYQTMCVPCNNSKGDGPRCRISHRS